MFCWTLAGGLGAEEYLLQRAPYTNDISQGAISELDSNASQQMADRFLLWDPSVVSRVDWSGFYFPATPPVPAEPIPFRVRFFADQGGSPSLMPIFEESVMATRSPLTIIQDFQTYNFSARLTAPFVAGRQTFYWFSVLETDSRTPDDSFRWFNSGPTHWPVGFSSRMGEGASWSVPQNVEQMSFSLIGTPVPEPSSGILLVVSVVVIFVALRFRNFLDRSVLKR